MTPCRSSPSAGRRHAAALKTVSAADARRAAAGRRGAGVGAGRAHAADAMETAGHAAAAQDALQQAEFLAEDELVEISPNVASGPIRLVCGEFGPLEPSIATAVPLWLALAMKKLRRCRVLPPRWLALAEVERVLAAERERDDALQPVPRFFFQIAAVLLHRAEDDIPSPSRLRRAVEDLASIRAGKLRRWTHANVRDRTNALKILHLASLEVEAHRPVLPRVLAGLGAMAAPALETDPLTPTASTSAPTTSAAGTATEPRRPPRRIIRRT